MASDNPSFRTKRISYYGARPPCAAMRLPRLTPRPPRAGNELPILMQNENGPCPLLALANVLMLRGAIYIHPDITEVTFEDLTARLAEHMLDASAKLSEDNEELRANQQQNLADGMAMFPKLLRGLDVNVGFTAIDHYEYSEDQVIFDLLNVPLVHGWLSDPQDASTHRVVGRKSPD